MSLPSRQPWRLPTRLSNWFSVASTPVWRMPLVGAALARTSSHATSATSGSGTVLLQGVLLSSGLVLSEGLLISEGFVAGEP